MSQSAKAVLKKLISTLRGDKRLAEMEFANYSDAFDFCRQKTDGCYESSMLCKYRFEKFSNFLRDGGNLFSSPSATVLLFSVSLYLKNNQSIVPRLIDYGGACGESINLLAKIFGDDILKTSWICESSQQVKESHNWDFANQMQFSSDLDSVLKEVNIDIFFTSGTIQSLPDPYEALEAVAHAKVPIVALTRNNFSFKPTIVAQRSTLSINGTGQHIERYGNPAMYYPNTSVLKSKIIETFTTQGYEVIVDTSGTASGVYGENNYSGDLVFARQ
jgi:putative methyltransferase (TIGR04325 family)